MEYRSPVCKARICRKSPLMFQHPSFILARRNNRHHFRVSSRVMPMPPGYTKVFGFVPTWCTKVRVARNCSAFFIAIFQRRFNLVHHRVTRTARARRRSGGQKRPSGAFLERGRVPDGAPEKAATNVAAFLLHHSLRDGLALRASARVRLAGTGRSKWVRVCEQGPRLSVSESGERTMYAARGVQPHERFCEAKWRPYRPTSEPD